MWLGIPYTSYGYNISLPVIPRMFIFCLICSVIYIGLDLPQTKRVVGSITGFSKFDDIDSNDKYYLTLIHGLVFGLVMFLLLKIYNPYLIQKKNIV